MTAFLQEEEIRAAYDAAELVVSILVAKDVILVPDYRPAARKATINRIAHDVADAVIRTQTFESGDITDLPGVVVERVNGVPHGG